MSLSCNATVQADREEWRKKVGKMDKEHSRHFTKKRNSLKSKKLSLLKVEKKLRKKKNDQELIKQMNSLTLDCENELYMLCEHERISVREIESHERSFYQALVGGLTTIAREELTLNSEKFGNLMQNIENIEHPKSEHSLNASNDSLWFTTPVSTPSGSLMGSRTNSLQSVNTFSRTSSVESLSWEDKDSRKTNNCADSLQKVFQTY